ncbi:MAG: helix-turn-helix transcriptional regulator [Deltaproteobacteria bacterium]|nr:helix-turn-helix transcriptional regulator [Deltaproteobacteria bacterium]
MDRPSAAEASPVRRATERFRRARLEAGLSLRQVAEKSGLAASTIHKIEAGRLIPSLAVCIRLADALGRRISYFVEDNTTAAVEVRHLPAQTGRVLHVAGTPLRFEHVAEPLVNPQMEAFIVTVARGGKSGAGVPIRYRGEEVVFGLAGRVRFVIRGEPYILKPGDTLHLKGDVPHTWENAGPGTARMLMVCAFAYGQR